MLGIADDTSFSSVDKNSSRKRHLKNVSFNEEEIVINPEDVDPSVGRFRNMIQSTVVPVKRVRMDMGLTGSSSSPSAAVFSAPPTFNSSLQSDLLLKQFNASLVPHLYQDLPPTSDGKIGADQESGSLVSLGSKMGLLLPNPAPDETPLSDDEDSPSEAPVAPRVMISPEDERIDDEVAGGEEPKKKKYAKEAWPGRKSLLSGL